MRCDAVCSTGALTRMARLIGTTAQHSCPSGPNGIKDVFYSPGRKRVRECWRIDLLVSLDVNVDTGVVAVLEAVLETVLAAEVATVVLVDADVFLSAHAGGTATVVLCDADVLTKLVTGRAGLLLGWLLLTFPSSALDLYVLFSLDLFGLLVVLVGRRKDAERDSAGGLAWKVLRCGLDARSMVLEAMSRRRAHRMRRAKRAWMILTGLWRRNPAWRLLGDLNALQDSNATCRTDKPDERRKRRRVFKRGGELAPALLQQGKAVRRLGAKDQWWVQRLLQRGWSRG